MTVLHINPDSASLEFHMKVAGPKFPPIAEFIRMLAIDVYGQPDRDRQCDDQVPPPRPFGAAVACHRAGNQPCGYHG
jgi:hypothetical protein